MTKLAHENFIKIEKAIEYIASNFKNQPNLDEIASAVNLSQFHFQRLFTKWSGVSPKQFVQYLTLNYTKKLLNNKSTVLNASIEAGYNSSSRLHDLFIQIEGMTPGEYKNQAKDIIIKYEFYPTFLGKILIASTPKGICKLFFMEDEIHGFMELENSFPLANFKKAKTENHKKALKFFQHEWNKIEDLKLHLVGTPFQINVWESLLKIPEGELTTYKDIAKSIGNPNGSRAVGTAIGSNPVALLIPCHRVIQTSGGLGGYKWGLTKKVALIGSEAIKKEL